MYELLSEIKYSTNLIYENVNRIILSKKRIGIYGNGIYASRIEKTLNKWGIIIDYHVIDDEYYDNNINEDSVIRISELNKFNNSILVIGFETLIGKEKKLQYAKSKALFFAPKIEILDFEHCYLDFDAITYDYLLNNIEEFQKTYDLFEDELSQRVMVEYINNCISGVSENFGLLNQDIMHDYDYDILFNDKKEGVIIECGAFDGKTVVEICEYLSDKDCKETILAIEPDDMNYGILCDRIKKYRYVIPINKGISDHTGQVAFSENGDSGSAILESIGNIDNKTNMNYTIIQVCSIDDLMNEYGKISAVLMDIEGAEFNALKGAMNTFNKCKPTFAIRVYHKKDDLITIPNFFNELKVNEKYRLYLRNSQNTRGPLDLTLYAV